MTRRNLFAMAGAAVLSRGLALASEARKQIKITSPDALGMSSEPALDFIAKHKVG